MSGNYAQDWKPRNLGGSIYYDPRHELEYWASRAGSDPMVAVPVATLRAAAAVRECGETTVLTGDEDGRLPKPLTIRCRKPEKHTDSHYNGYCSWPATRSNAACPTCGTRDGGWHDVEAHAAQNAATPESAS